MADALRSELQFQRSRRCSSGGCVEVALLPGGGGAAVRDSTDGTQQPLAFDKWQWFRFIASVKSGQFDL